MSECWMAFREHNLRKLYLYRILCRCDDSPRCIKGRKLAALEEGVECGSKAVVGQEAPIKLSGIWLGSRQFQTITQITECTSTKVSLLVARVNERRPRCHWMDLLDDLSGLLLLLLLYSDWFVFGWWFVNRTAVQWQGREIKRQEILPTVLLSTEYSTTRSSC